MPTPTETYDPSKSDPSAKPGAFRPMRPGPYPEGARPDQVFFRTQAGHDAEGRQSYEKAQTPWQTDLLNERFIGKARVRRSPLGDPVPFSAYLIGRLANPTGYDTQFINRARCSAATRSSCSAVSRPQPGAGFFPDTKLG